MTRGLPPLAAAAAASAADRALTGRATTGVDSPLGVGGQVSMGVLSDVDDATELVAPMTSCDKPLGRCCRMSCSTDGAAYEKP